MHSYYVPDTIQGTIAQDGHKGLHKVKGPVGISNTAQIITEINY